MCDIPFDFIVAFFLYWIRRLSNPENRDAFGIIVSYAVKVKLFLGALGGEVSAELPFVLMHPKVISITDFLWKQKNTNKIIYLKSFWNFWN